MRLSSHLKVLSRDRSVFQKHAQEFAGLVACTLCLLCRGRELLQQLVGRYVDANWVEHDP